MMLGTTERASNQGWFLGKGKFWDRASVGEVGPKFILALTPSLNSSFGTVPSLCKDTIMASSKYVEIDGSVMEGGGQILRNTVSLSALLKRPIRIIKIRAKRDRPGTW